MEQRVSLITLGVANVRRARTFYQHMGWIGQETEETVFIQAGGLAVVLWDRDKLALDCGVNDHKAAGFSGIVLAHNVRSHWQRMAQSRSPTSTELSWRPTQPSGRRDDGHPRR